MPERPFGDDNTKEQQHARRSDNKLDGNFPVNSNEQSVNDEDDDENRSKEDGNEVRFIWQKKEDTVFRSYIILGR